MAALTEELLNPVAAIRARVADAVADQTGVATVAALEQLDKRYPILAAILAGREIRIKAEIVE